MMKGIKMQQEQENVEGQENVEAENKNREQEADRQLRVILKGAAEIVGREELRDKLVRSLRTGRPLHIKLGLDPSAPDIHLGHAVVLRKLKQMQDMGHHIIIIIGDFTGRIGDPTGKSKGRKALSDSQVLENAITYEEQIFKVLDRDKTEVRFNGEWLELLNLEQVLKLAATTTVARMLERDDFKKRFEGNVPIGLHEFFYPLMQAFDSAAIEADLELGGTDQTFNILMGRTLQKNLDFEPQAALFMPILEGLDGVEKMSKSLGNYIGVDEEANIMFKKVMEVPDSLILRYFELATDESPDRIDELRAQLAAGRNPRDVKLALAHIITKLYHGEVQAGEAARFYEEAFTRKAVPEQVPELETAGGRKELQELFPELVAAGYAGSINELRRLVKQGGIQADGSRAADVHLLVENGSVLRIGKKRFVRIMHR